MAPAPQYSWDFPLQVQFTCGHLMAIYISPGSILLPRDDRTIMIFIFQNINVHMSSRYIHYSNTLLELLFGNINNTLDSIHVKESRTGPVFATTREIRVIRNHIYIVEARTVRVYRCYTMFESSLYKYTCITSDICMYRVARI